MVDAGLDAREYAVKIKEASTWGGYVDMIVMSTLNNVQIRVYMTDTTTKPYKLISTVGDSDKIVNVLFTGNSHYDALVELKRDLGDLL